MKQRQMSLAAVITRPTCRLEPFLQTAPSEAVAFLTPPNYKPWTKHSSACLLQPLSGFVCIKMGITWYKRWVLQQLFWFFGLLLFACVAKFVLRKPLSVVDSQLTCCTCRSHDFYRNCLPGAMISCDCMVLYVCYPSIHKTLIIYLSSWILFMGKKMIQMERLLPQQSVPPPAPFWCPWAACVSLSHSNHVAVFELTGSFSLTLMVNRKVFARISGNGEQGGVVLESWEQKTAWNV